MLYVLDGNTTFPLAVSTLRFLELYDEIEPVAVVGIGFPVDSAAMRQTMPERTRDFTPTENPAFWDHFLEQNPDGPAYQGSGGSDAFLRFLVDELTPLVERRCPVASERTALHGHSFGGLFALHTLFTEPPAFAD